MPTDAATPSLQIFKVPVQLIHFVMIHRKIRCHNIGWSKPIHNGVIYVTGVYGLYAGVDLCAQIIKIALTLGPTQPAVIFFQMVTVTQQMVESC
jgi:hypothetical protein